jgi:hypothetical protein
MDTIGAMDRTGYELGPVSSEWVHQVGHSLGELTAEVEATITVTADVAEAGRLVEERLACLEGRVDAGRLADQALLRRLGAVEARLAQVLARLAQVEERLERTEATPKATGGRVRGAARGPGPGG